MFCKWAAKRIFVFANVYALLVTSIESVSLADKNTVLELEHKT